MDISRHDLLTVRPEQWPATLKTAGADLADLSSAAASLLASWAERRWPLVARRPLPSDTPASVPAGLPLPPWIGKRRLFFALPPDAIGEVRSPPPLADLAETAPPDWRDSLACLLASAGAAGVTPRVFGSLLWQSLTGLPYLTPGSDLDLLWPVQDVPTARAVVDLLDRVSAAGRPRLDAELLLPDGDAVHWREWHTASPSGLVLCKSMTALRLRPVDTLFAQPGPAAPEEIGAVACAALLQELDTWPKPGLVGPSDPGSHRDMTADTFRRSIDALAAYFTRFAEAGRRDAAFPELRAIGLAAESAMLDATRGVNTHRGAIFTLGLLCAAAGLPGGPHDGAALTLMVRDRWGAAVAANPPSSGSHGAAVRANLGADGARGEAAAGFPRLRDVALPALRVAQSRFPADPNAARVQTLFALLATLDDTNLLHRGGREGLAYVQRTASNFLDAGGIAHPDWPATALRAHHAFVARKLSPGGSADLLAAALFLNAWSKERQGASPLDSTRRSAAGG